MATFKDGSAGVGGRGVICLAVMAVVASLATLPLAAAPSPDQRVRVKLDVTGELVAAAGRDAESVHEPITVAAVFEFLESDVPSNSPEASEKVVATRRYLEAAAEISIAGQPSRTALAMEARTLSIARLGTTALPFLHDAFLSREELDLLETPFDSILLDELLPKTPVADGDAWQISGDVTAGLLAIDTVDNGTLEAKLDSVVDGVARITLAGVIDGAIDGVPTHVVVEGTFTAAAREEEDRHVIEGHVAGVEVVLRERRQASHVAPGFDVEARLTLARASADTASDAASDTATLSANVAAEPVATLRRRGTGRPGRLWHRDAEGRYDLVYDAGWRSVEDSPSGHVLRLVDHGALVAQCSIMTLPRANADVTPTIDEVRRDIQSSLAGQFGQFEGASEFTRDGIDAGDAAAESPAGGSGAVNVVRVASTGTAEGLPFHWIHYVLSDGEGRRASVTFMLEESLRKRFGDADRALVDGLRLEPDAVREARLPEKTVLP